MKRTHRVAPGDVAPDAPLRLDIAAQIRFTDGSITGKALRREAERGRLDIFRVAGKDFTTLAAVDEMIRRCHVLPTEPASASDAEKVARLGTPSEMDKGRSAQASLLAKIAHEKGQQKRSKRTLRDSTSPTSAMVIHGAFSSPTS